jgi:hypothetical protein
MLLDEAQLVVVGGGDGSEVVRASRNSLTGSSSPRPSVLIQQNI